MAKSTRTTMTPKFPVASFSALLAYMKKTSPESPKARKVQDAMIEYASHWTTLKYTAKA